MKILLVEDDPIARNLCENFLRGLGHDVEVVEDAERGFGSFMSKVFQIVISDWSLPGKSGAEFCQSIRALKRHDYTYFILITSHQGEGKLLEAMDAGVDDFLMKPLDLSALKIRLRVAERILDFHHQLGNLQDLVPICMYCKKIRNDQAFWEHVETYIAAQTGADVTHSLCPECYREKVQPELDDIRRQSPQSP